MDKKKPIPTILEDAAKDPAVRAVAASAAVAGGAVAGKLVHDSVERAHRRKQRRFRLDPDETAAQGIKRVVAGQLDNTLALLKGEGAESPGKAVHDARKALKRSRAALRLGRDVVGRERYRQENSALRDAGRDLSDQRDSQVLLQTLESLGPPEAFAGFHDALSRSAAGTQHHGEDGEHGTRAAIRELEQARSRLEAWSGAGTGGPEQLSQAFERIYRRGRRALRAATREPSVENLHELRKRSKDLWHAAQLLQTSCPGRSRALARRAHALSDLLGDEHDLAILHERSRTDPALLEPAERKLLASLIKRRRKRLRRQALSCAARLYRRKPRKLRRRLALS